MMMIMQAVLRQPCVFLCQGYAVLVTREPLPMAVTFSDDMQQLDYECPVTLNVFYRPVSINKRCNFKKKRLSLMNTLPTPPLT